MDRGRNAAYALIATEILASKTQFFDNIPTDHMKEFKNFVAATITRHTEADGVNGGVAVELLGLGNVSFENCFSGKTAPEVAANAIGAAKSRTIAGVVYPLVSLINHSCDSNVSCLNHTANGKMVVMAHRALTKGEPLHVMYNGGFTNMNLYMRQAYLDQNYHFKCQCIACEENWPTKSELLDRKPIYCCPPCSKKFCEQDKASTEFKKCLLTRPRYKCGSCGKVYKEPELKRTMQDNMGLVQEFNELLETFRFVEAHDTFLKASEYLQFHLCPPNGILYSAQDLFRKTMLLIFYYAQQL